MRRVILASFLLLVVSIILSTLTPEQMATPVMSQVSELRLLEEEMRVLNARMDTCLEEKQQQLAYLELLEQIGEQTGLPLNVVECLVAELYRHELVEVTDIILGMYEYESNFNPSCINKHSGASGLGQMLPSTARYISGVLEIPYEKGDLLDPEYNVRITLGYLKHLMDKKEGDLQTKLAYGLKRYGDQTKSYIPTVYSRAVKYEEARKNLVGMKEEKK